MIENHRRFTGSAVAEQVLDHWPQFLESCVKVMPIDFKRVLEEMAAEEAQTGVTV